MWNQQHRSSIVPSAMDRGSVTAEYAVLLPAAALVLGAAINVAVVGIDQVRLEEAAAAAARQLARGEDTSVVTSTVHTMAGTEVTVDTSATGDWATVHVTKSAPGPAALLPGFELDAEGNAPQQWTVDP